MDKVQLKNFVSLAQTLNFSAVAKREYISQPALTKQINRLEGELGVTLFHRTKHGVTLTFAGEEFYKHARDIIMGIEQAEHHMEHIRKGQLGSLQVSSVLGMEKTVADSIGRFGRQYPEISVSIKCGTGIDQIMTINKKACDVFFSFSDLLSSFPDIDSIPLPGDRFAVYVNKADAAVIGAEGFGHLNSLTNLMESSAEGPFLTPRVFAVMNALGLKTDNIGYQSSSSTVIIAIQAGLGFSLLPSQMNFGLLPDNIAKIPLDCPEAVIGQALGWHKESKNVAVKNFVELVRGRSEN